MKKISLLVLSVFIVFLLLGCSHNAQHGLLPKSIGQFELASSIKGEEAKQSVIALHRGAKMELKEAEIGDYYAGNSQAKLWVGKAKNTSQAKILFKRMTAKISKGTSPFGMPKMKTQKGVKLMEMEAMGQKHYYYVSGDKVVWLSADTALANEAIADVIEEVK